MNKTALLFSVLFMCSCSKNLVVRTLPLSNPTTYVYPFPMEVVKKSIAKEFIDSSFYAMDVIWAERDIKRRQRAEQIFFLPINKNDFYLHKDGFPFRASLIYTDTTGKGYPYYAEFQLHLVRIDNDHTQVSILTYDSMIEYGKSWFSWHGVGRVHGAKSVMPTTIEQYEILLKIGKGLGMAADMPILMN